MRLDPETEVGYSTTEYKDYLARIVTQQAPPDNGSYVG